MKAWELLKLLEEGKTLQRIYHNVPECIKTVYRATYQHSDNDGVSWYNVHKYEFYEWGSACGTWEGHFLDLIENPEEWTVK